MSILWAELDVKYGGSPHFLRSVGYEEIGRDGSSVTYRVYLKLKVAGNSSSYYGYGINWRVDGGSWMKIKNASPRWYGNEGYREFTTVITKSVGANGGETYFTLEVDGLGGSCDYSLTYKAFYSTFNTAPYWGSGSWIVVRENDWNGYWVASQDGSIPNYFKVREDVGMYLIDWGGAVDNDNNINRYELYCQVNEGAWTRIYSGGANSFLHYVPEGASTQGTIYRYFVRAIDSYGLASGDLYCNPFQKNSVSGANPSASNGILFDTSELTLWWDGASNTNGNTSFTYRVTSPNIKVYNIEKLTASGGKVKVLKEGTSTDPYISFEELKNMASNYSYETHFDLNVITRNAYGSEATKSVRIHVDLRTEPQPPTAITVGGHTSTSLGAFLIPSMNKPTVTWSGAYDKLGGSLTYDIYFKIGNGSETVVNAGTNTKVTLPINNVSASATLGVRVVAKTWYGKNASASNNSETLHYYNPPSVYTNNPKRTITSFVVDIHSQLNTSIPKVAFSKQRYTGNGTTKDFTGTKHTATIVGLEANSTFDFTAIVCDNTGLSGDQQTVFKVVPAIPKFSVRENGVGVNCINDTEQILAVDGGLNVKGGAILDNATISTLRTNTANVGNLVASSGANIKGDILFNDIDLTQTRRFGERQIRVGGDPNKYYPVRMWIHGVWGFATNKISIGRSYDWEAPDTWNTATHKGGLTLTLRWAGDTSWGGNSKELIVDEFSETYSTMVAGMQLSTNGIIVWLRGGGALYQIDNDYGSRLYCEVYLEDYTASNGEVFPVRDYNVAYKNNEIVNRQPLKNWNSYYDILTNKPEVQAMATRDWIRDGVNWNDVITAGMYGVVTPNYSSNPPPNSYYYGILIVFHNNGVVGQIYMPHSGSHFMQYRVRFDSGVWTNWANVGWSAFSLEGVNASLLSEIPTTLEEKLIGEDGVVVEEVAPQGNEALVHIINTLDNRIKELELQLEEANLKGGV
jgi:hypothetical protein